MSANQMTDRTSAAKTSGLSAFCVCPICLSDLETSGSGLRCVANGHEFQVVDEVPMLLPSTADDVEERYLSNYRRMATDDLEKPFEGNRQARHQKLMEFIGSVSGKRVLDIGSSDAEYLRGMDASVKVALDIALEYLVKIPDQAGVIAVCGDAEQLPIRAGFFDVVIISDVLEHVLHPEKVVAQLARICRPDTRLIVHVPWEEDLSQYQDVHYEFTHLRSFNAFSFGWLFRDFYEKRSRGAYPYLTMPLPYTLYGRMPLFMYRLVRRLMRTRLNYYFTHRWEVWIAELPKRERWLLWFYKPIFRQFELRILTPSRTYRIARRLRRIRNSLRG